MVEVWNNGYQKVYGLWERLPAAIRIDAGRVNRGWKAAPTIELTPKILKLAPMRLHGNYVKEKAKEQAERERAQLANSEVSEDPKTAYRPANENPLVGSTWRVVSAVTKEPYPEWASMVVTFQTNSKVTTLMMLKDGSTQTIVESYRIVEDVLVITGKDYVYNGKFSIEGKQMINTGTFLNN